MQIEKKYAQFKDKTLERQMQDVGYVYLPGFLNNEQLEKLEQLYYQYHQTVTSERGMWNSIHDLGRKLGNEVSNKILEIVTPLVEKIFEHWQMPTGTFMSKCPNDKSYCELHRDFSIFDESKFGYRNLWIPLVDTTKGNGALFVVPKSHMVFTQILPPGVQWPYQKYGKIMAKYITRVYCKKGDLVVYDQCLLHGSWRNNSDKPRPVVHMGILPEHAGLIYYKVDRPLPQMMVSAYKVEPDFFFSSATGMELKPQDFIRSFEIKYDDYSEEAFDGLFKSFCN